MRTPPPKKKKKKIQVQHICIPLIGENCFRVYMFYYGLHAGSLN